MHNLSKANGFPNVRKIQREGKRYKSMTKMEILNDLRSCIKEGSLKEDDFFETVVFYYLAGRYPDLSLCRCVQLVDQLRAEILIQWERQSREDIQA